MKEKITGWSCYIVALCAIIILLITSIDLICFDRGFYEQEYESLDTAQSLDMSQVDLMKATTTLLDYLQDEKDSIEVEIVVREMPRQAFNERESLHMVDVKALYQNVLQLRLVCIVVMIACLSFVIVQKRKGCRELLATAYAQTAVFFVCFVAMLGIWAAVDFTSLWDSFHRLFFSNDLWLLNPRTDLMINMFPEDFFFHMVTRLTLVFVVAFLMVLAVSLWYLNRRYHFINIKKKGKNI